MKEQRQKSLQLEVTAIWWNPVPSIDRKMRATGRAGLPKDDANADIGTIFHERLPDRSMPKRAKMRFAPNSGYAFAVGDDAWHSADPVHDRVKFRDSSQPRQAARQFPGQRVRNRMPF